MPFDYEPRFFTPEELVPKVQFAMLKERSLILLDARILWTADKLRERYGKIIINDWSFDGELQYSGWRPGDCKTGATFSQHKYGRALDLKFPEANIEDVIHDMRHRGDRPIYQHIGAVEVGLPWLHIDCRNRAGEILFFEPEKKEETPPE